MNIWAPKGHQVIVTEKTKDNGYSTHSELVKKHLVVGLPYTVAYTVVGNWHTDVVLIEFPGIKFNSVNFEDYE